MTSKDFNEFDRQFIKNIKDILKNGSKYASRAVWADGTQSICTKLFGVVNRYNSDYSNTPPVSAFRKLGMKNAIDEILWIWQKKSNNVKDLNSHIWDLWADCNGSIGAGYGFQVASKLRPIKIEYDLGNNEKAVETLFLDQTDYVIHELKYNPFSRRILTSLYSINETGLMGLDPCCYSCTWNVTEKDCHGYLNLLLNQRSQDMMVANNWNVFQYWVLQNLIANECGLEVGELVHVIADCHIYDRHEKIAKNFIKLSRQKDLDFEYPEIKFPNKPFYEIKPVDILIKNYKPMEDIKGIEVAI